MKYKLGNISPVSCEWEVGLWRHAREQDDEQEEHQKVLQAQVNSVQKAHLCGPTFQHHRLKYTELNKLN